MPKLLLAQLGPRKVTSPDQVSKLKQLPENVPACFQIKNVCSLGNFPAMPPQLGIPELAYPLPTEFDEMFPEVN